MAIVNQDLYLEITPGAIPPILNVTEYDENMQVIIHLRQRGQAYEIPSGTTAKVEGTLAGRPFRVAATPASGEDTVTFELSEAMTGYAGRAWTKIKLIKDNKPVHTCGFWLNCDRAGVEAGDVVAMTGFEQQLKDGVYDYLDDKQLPNYVPIDMISGGNRVPKEENGITFTWNQDKTKCIVNGTNTGDVPAVNGFAGTRTSFPGGVAPGGNYYVSVSTTSYKAALGFYFYKNGEWDSWQFFFADGSLDVPQDATGMIALICVFSGETVNNDSVSNIGLFAYETNRQLGDKITYASIRNLRAAEDNSYPLDFANRRLSDNANKIYTSSTLRISTQPLFFDNKFLKIEVDEGYKVAIAYKTVDGEFVELVRGSGTHNFYAGKSVPVVFSLYKDPEMSICPRDSVHLRVSEADPCATGKPVCGIVQHKVAFDSGTAFFGGDVRYTANADYWSSSPIKIPKSGLRIGFNPKYHGYTYLHDNVFTFPAFRLTAVKKTDDGLVLQTDNSDLNAVSRSTHHKRASVYIPYIEDCYIIISFYIGGDVIQHDLDYSDLLYVSSGEVERGYCGVTNIFPTALTVNKNTQEYPNQNALRIVGDESVSAWTYSSAVYYATVLRLKDVRRVVCSPKYTLLAEIFKIEQSGNIVRYSDVFGVWDNNDLSGSTNTAGVSVIDFSDYDFDGFALVAIQSTVTYKEEASSNLYTMRYTTMGGMARYDDVIASVCVEYKPGVNVAYVPGMNAVIAENIHTLTNWNVPEFGEGKYVFYSDTNAYGFMKMYDASVAAFYGGTYLANNVLQNVSAKSAITAIANRNGRMRKRQAVEQDQPGTDGVPTTGIYGYGIQCTNFVSILLGQREEYNSWAHAYGNNRRFTHYDFDYRYDLDKLRPGDILAKSVVKQAGGGEYYHDAHCRMVESIVTVNGAVKAVNIIEAWAPFNRRATFIDETYFPSGNKIVDLYDVRLLEDYKHISRIKPEYIKPIREVFELHPSDTSVGTVMCDRGTESIYGIHSHTELSFKDEDVTDHITLYRNGVELSDLSKSHAETVNGLKMLKVALTNSGTYTVKTDQSNDVQETFFVKDDVDPIVETDLGDKIELEIPNVSDFLWLEVWYGTSDTSYNEATRKSPTYIKDDLEIDAERNVGTLVIPKEIDGKVKSSINRIYNTRYGTYWANANGRVSTEWYGVD